MIEQKWTQGIHVIKVETAESIDDAKLNKFPDGIFTRYFIDNKPVENYNVFIKFIVNEVKNNKNNLIPEKNNLLEKRKNIVKENNERIKKEFLKIKNDLKDDPAFELMFKQMDNSIQKISLSGIRNIE